MSLWTVLAPAVQVLGWTLVHFVWQAALIGAIYALVRLGLPRGVARYRLGMLALAMLALCPLLTAWYLLSRLFAVVDVGSVSTVAGSGIAPLRALFTPDTQHADWPSIFAAWFPWLVLAWCSGVVLLTFRVWRHWRKLKLLVRTAQALPVWQQCLHGLARRFGLRREVRLLCSGRVATPTLIGWIRPVILLPIAVTCGFPVAQVELILAHELAHLRRFDHLANLFQIVIETLLFYHPVVHWISREVRNEREICCDALALRVTGGERRELVAALLELEEFREHHAGLTLAASGGVLLERVWHIADGTARGASMARPPARFIGMMFGLLMGLLLLSLLWRQAEVRRDIAASASVVGKMLTAQLLPAPIRVPVLAVANLVPDRMRFSPSRIEMRAQKSDIAEDVTAAPAAQLHSWNVAAPAFAIADLSPHRVALAPLSIPAASVEPVQTVAPALSPSAIAPEPVHIEQPVYPLSALEQRIEGQVVIEFGLNADGSVNAPVVISARPANLFDHAAMHALLGWRFATRASENAGERYRQVFSFTLHPADGDAAAEEVQARAGCNIVTGSNICRVRNLGEAAFAASVLH